MSEFNEVKDNGTRVEHATGSTRQGKEGKGRYDLIPWYCIHRLAKHYENGARVYADRNWEKGLPLSSFVDSGLRHFIQFISGDRSEDHLSAVLWNVAGLMWTEEQVRLGKLPIELANMPDIKVASFAHAIEAIDRARTKSPEQLVAETGAHPTGNGFVHLRHPEDTDLGYPQEAKDAVKQLAGHWADHPPYTELADAYIAGGLEWENAKQAFPQEAKPANGTLPVAVGGTGLDMGIDMGYPKAY